MNTMKSIIQENRNCLKCGSPYTDLHHVRLGNSSREKCEKWGMVVYICRVHHRWLHDHPEEKEEIQRLAQRCFEDKYSHDKYMEVFGKNYL